MITWLGDCATGSLRWVDGPKVLATAKAKCFDICAHAGRLSTPRRAGSAAPWCDREESQ
jgi:hypothetical protein